MCDTCGCQGKCKCGKPLKMDKNCSGCGKPADQCKCPPEKAKK
jgi:hypothetical protein